MAMAAAAASSSSSSTSIAGSHALRRQWRYTWEALAHIPFLRLYLFHRALPSNPSDLRAELRLDDSLLLITFSLAGDPVSLRVPVPRVLVDPSVPPQCRAAGDHVEVRLALVLAVDHPVVAAAFPPLVEPPAPLSLHDDIKSLTSGDVHLYCKSCSSRLTNQPLRNIVEMPSLNWEDIADNWFGGCCTSFGGAGEKLVSQYINAYGRLDGTSLLDATSISIKVDYLEMDLACGIASSMSSDGSVSLQAVSDVHVGKDHITEETTLNNSEDKAYCKMRIASSHVQPAVILEEGHCVSNTEQNGDTAHTDQYNNVQMEYGVDVNSEKCKNDYHVGSMEKPTKETELSLADPWNCCCDSRNSGKAGDDTSDLTTQSQKTQTTLDILRDYKLTKSISLGSSFIVKASNLLSGVDWVELLCVHCLSPLGSFPSQHSHSPVDGRVRLFKCYTSSNLPVQGPSDVFRGHTLERLFVNLLLEIAEDEISFRTVVRDLKTKRAMLQIVLISPKAWLFSGYCFDNDIDGSNVTANLQPSVKLLYFNCTDSSEADLRTVEEWSSKYWVEELYMMERQIIELIECLSSAMGKFPLSCSSLEGMHLSSLER